jgi:hypothetical protein
VGIVMKRRDVVVLCLGGILGGCAARVIHETASGRPERQFSSGPEAVRAALVGELVNRGYNITQESQSVVVGQKFSNNLAANLMLGSSAYPTVMVRSSFTLIPNQAGTRVVGDIAIVGNPGSAFERVTPMSNSQGSKEMQDALNAIVV